MGIANKIIPHYTYEDWVHWEGKWELIEGHPIAMSPTPVPQHQRVATELRTELTLALRNAGCKHCRTYDPLDYKIAEDTILIPDILIVCGEIKKKFLDFPPVLLAEILSPSTALKDRHTKYELYEQQGVAFYLIVDTEQKRIELFQLINSKYELQQESVAPQIALAPDCIIKPNFQNVFD